MVFCTLRAVFFIMDETMPQGRIILKSISESKKLAGLKTDGARLLYTWLIPHVDVNGCFSGDPEVIRGKVFTRLGKTTQIIEDYLIELSDFGLIVRYSAKGDDFLCIPDFIEKQPHLQPNKEGKPRIPRPTPDQLQTKSHTSKVKQSKVKQSKKDLELPRKPRKSSVRFDYETYKLTGITDQDYTDWSEAFPAVDIRQEIKSARQWLIDNPTKRKTLIRRFLTNWLRRNQEKGGVRKNEQSTKHQGNHNETYIR